VVRAHIWKNGSFEWHQGLEQFLCHDEAITPHNNLKLNFVFVSPSVASISNLDVNEFDLIYEALEG
jgi:hypothetical protein